jgi:hypothetical protein
MLDKIGLERIDISYLPLGQLEHLGRDDGNEE